MSGFNTVPTLGGTIVLKGSGFGNLSENINIWVGLQACNITAVSYQEITCFVPPGTGVDVLVTLIVSGQQGTLTYLNRTGIYE
jgi:hypothetical protein